MSSQTNLDRTPSFAPAALVLLALCLTASACSDASPVAPGADAGFTDAGGGRGTCGDGTRDPGEQCDDGNRLAGDGCSVFCTAETDCGDGTVDRGEQCDDGNVTDGDGCSGRCELESGGARCGNGFVERGELCDGTDVAGATCESQGFSGGVLRCDTFCQFETSRCISGSGCGDGTVAGVEDCDGANLNRATCALLGYSGGTLGCRGDCTFDVSFCERGASRCGDGVVGDGEVCDGADLDHQSCASLGLGAGDLSCRADCNGFNREACGSADRCGDGVAGDREKCDGADLHGRTCEMLGFTGGVLACNSECAYDSRGCTSGSGSCGDGIIDEREVCDRSSLGGQSCETQGYAGGALACSRDCTAFDTRRCATDAVPPGWTCEADYYNAEDGCDCGCGVVDPDCDDETVASCDFCGPDGSCNVGPCPGTIEEADNATCDASVGTCGDGVVGTGEACEASDLDGQTCESLGLDGGTLACAVNCLSFDTRGCTSATAPPEWTCDAEFFGAGDGCDCGCGVRDPDCATESVDACLFCDDAGSCSSLLCPGNIDPADNAACVETGDCGNGEIDTGEVCDGAALGGATCESLGHGAGSLDCEASCENFDLAGCAASAEPPASWTCSATWYGDGTGCDCGCGALDPDCLSPAAAACDFCANIGSCATGACPGSVDPASNWLCASAGDDCGNGAVDPGELCDGANLNGQTCELQGFDSGTLTCAPDCASFVTSGCVETTVPAGWSCDDAYYGDGLGCDCDCGAYDPDCDDTDTILFNCLAGETCDATGMCVGEGTDVPPEWTCEDLLYDDGTGCDCDCGAYDPDCDDPDLDIFGCDDGDTCDAAGSCISAPLPPEWTCDADFYDAVDGCDCDCGALDPDCDDPAAPVFGCPSGQICDVAGACTPPPAPDEWTCPPSFYAATDGCDCDCGAYDPDCDDPDEPVFNCDEGFFCDEAGRCVIEI